MGTTKKKTTVEKKKVFICVPIERAQDDEINQAVAVAKQDYCKAKGIEETDVYFYDFLHDLKDLYEEQTNKEGGNMEKYRGLSNVGWILSTVAICDEIIFGTNWGFSRSCRAISKVAEVYNIPEFRIMLMEQKRDTDETESRKLFLQKHHIEVLWKG